MAAHYVLLFMWPRYYTAIIISSLKKVIILAYKVNYRSFCFCFSPGLLTVGGMGFTPECLLMTTMTVMMIMMNLRQRQYRTTGRKKKPD